MNTGQFYRLLRPAAFLLLFAALSPVYASSYSTSISGGLILNTQNGDATISRMTPITPGSTTTFVDPPGYGTATATATNSLLAANVIQVLATTDGNAIATQDPIYGLGTTSYATGTVSDGLKITNPGSTALTLFAEIDFSWAWLSLIDNIVNETVTNALSLDLYADGNYVQTLANVVSTNAPGSDSFNQIYQIDLSDPLATLAPGQSRTFKLVASATSSATAIPEPGTLFLMLLGLAGIARSCQRRA
jgi:hypothetical protein